MTIIKLKRIYERRDITDGERIFVDRLWPRGVRHSTTNVDLWFKDVAPTKELRKWFRHDPKRWVEFKSKYKKELENSSALERLARIAIASDIITLVYASKDVKRNNAVVLKNVLEFKIKSMVANGYTAKMRYGYG
jgi:uncharacterized protein YeaO (DUF488 family)